MNVRLFRNDDLLAIDQVLTKEKKKEIHVSVIINIKRDPDATATVGLIIRVNKSLDEVDKTLVLDTNTEFSIRELEDDQLKQLILKSEYLQTHADEFIPTPEVIIDKHEIMLDYYTDTMDELKEAMQVLSTLD